MSEVATKKTVMVNIDGVLKPRKQAIKKHNFMKPKFQTPQEVAEGAIQIVRERRKIEEALDARIAEYREKLEESSTQHYNDGMRAASSGKPSSTNPHASGSLAHKLWNQGHKDQKLPAPKAKKDFSNLKSFKDAAAEHGLSVVTTNKGSATHHAVDKDGNVHGKYNALDYMSNGHIKPPKTIRESAIDESLEIDDVTEELSEADNMHRFRVTLSDPSHDAVSMRKKKIQKFMRVPGHKSIPAAHRIVTDYYKKQGYKVHEAEHVGMVESVELDEAAVYQVKHGGHSTATGDYSIFPQGKSYTNLVTKYGDSAHKTAKLLKDKGFVDVHVLKNGKPVNEADSKPVSPFNWKEYKSGIDWSKDKWDEPKRDSDEDGVTKHKAGETKKPAVDPDAPKKSVGRPKGKYGSYLKADKRTDDERAAIGAKVHSNPTRKKAYADSIAARREFKDLMNKAIKQKQAEIYHKEGK